ncbi:AAA family ATPase [Cesiribacter andamanensis]|uniref:Replicative DNA helicase n=1 Tax=Cesiribacter andamanensis AMV16 TaxID=1279009 RepID=M7NVL8_9BACT|nr:AAA family ATPase [Cesiribacter andamanensis]EMR02524.1 hypothetical protein ADICEAN_02331 [Cesiribacter andamanensis AMV16]
MSNLPVSKPIGGYPPAVNKGTLPKDNPYYLPSLDDAVNAAEKERKPWEDPRILEIIKLRTIDLKAEIPKPPVVLAIRQGMEEYSICRIGNFSLVTGKAKSRKTFVLSMLTAATLSGNEVCNAIRSYLPKEKRGILYFDTEQDECDAQESVIRSAQLAQIEDTNNLRPVWLGEEPTQDRYETIWALIHIHSQSVGFVVIDGIRDLIDSVNDEAGSKKLVDDIRRWASKYQCHIVMVIHENKAASTIRGHLGTELQNKAETVFRVEKVANNEDVSIVHPEYTRKKPFKPFAIGYNSETNLPEILHDFDVDGALKEMKKKQKPQEAKKWELERYSLKEHCTYLAEVFQDIPKQRGSDFRENVKEIYSKHSDFFKKDAERAALFFEGLGLIESNKEEERNKAKQYYWLSEKARYENSPL